MRTRLLFIFFFLFSYGYATNYYIMAGGTDTNSGKKITEAWKTITRLNQAVLQPGDTIFFEGGKEFIGSIYFPPSVSGTRNKFIVVTSLGSSKAVINSGNSVGFYAYNNEGIVLENLIFKGSGTNTNTSAGVVFYSDLANDAQLENLILYQVEVYGYLKQGISIGSWNKRAGYTKVQLSHCGAHDNGEAGISSYGESIYAHHHWEIRYCKAYNNRGRADITSTHTGNGIMISCVDSLLIEHCEAYYNGAYNAHPGGGPVGIWTYNTNHALIQYNESHHNHAGNDADGGGFDFDGGTNNSLMQYNYAHDNEGPGYLIAQYIGAPTMHNNSIRYNISQNDARKNGTGAISIWGGDPFSAAYIYNNTVYLNRKDMRDSKLPSCVSLYNVNYNGVILANNIFTCADSVLLVSGPVAHKDSAWFHHNSYFSYDSVQLIRWGDTLLNSVSDWLSIAPMQENANLQRTAIIADPLLSCPGCGGYQLRKNSPSVDKGIPVDSLYFLPGAKHDFYGMPVPLNQRYDRGASESDNLAPELSLYGKDTLQISVYTSYLEPGYQAIDKPWNNDISQHVNILGTVDTAQLGWYELLYQVSDSSGNASTARRWIKVEDTTAPIIRIKGKDTIRHEVYFPFTDSGFEISDNYDKQVTGIINGNVDLHHLGTYTITCSAKDSSGNEAVLVLRTVYITDTTAPSIMLKGQDTLWLQVNDTFLDSGYEAKDNYDKFLVIDTLTDLVSTQNAGVYFIRYRAVDSSGNTASSASRIIVVQQTGNISVTTTDPEILVFPNPATQELYLRSEQAFPENTYAMIFNVLGERVKTVSLEKSTTRIATDTFKKGIYVLQIIMPGVGIIHGKIIIQ